MPSESFAKRSHRVVASWIKTCALACFLTIMSVVVGVASALRAPRVLDEGRTRRPWRHRRGIRRHELRARVEAARVRDETNEQKTHLFVCVHGLAGTPDDLCAIEARLLSQRGAATHRVTCNAPLNSFDGVDAGARRIVEELREVRKKYPGLRRLTLYGNSLGGIYARYVAGLLYAESKDGTMLDGLTPCTFLTTATPHLGVGPWGYFKIVPETARNLWARNLGASVEELTLRDGHRRASGRPLLADMADPETKDPVDFIAALGAFERRCAYANAVNDFLVSYETAAISPEYLDSETERRWRTLEKPQIVEEYVVEGSPMPPTTTSTSHGWKKDSLALQRRMASGLRTLTWKHVNVAFPGPTPLAHNKICALQRSEVIERLFKEGEFIVDHQANYLLEPLRRQTSS
jgi:hypothetical protein